jgi:tetratricopeptide (TPR) repeat protein
MGLFRRCTHQSTGPTLLCVFLITTAGCGEKPPAPTRADHVRIAEEALKDGRYREAAAAYGEAAAYGPPDGTVLKKQAAALATAWDFANATAPARQAADLLPDDVEAQLLAATVLLRRSAFEEVMERMDAFLAKHPENVEALVALANARARLTNSNGALAGFVRARDEQEYETRRATMRQGATSWDDRDAEQVFEKAVKVNPDNAESQMARVNFLLAAGRSDAAAAALERFIARYPGRARQNHTLGVYYLQHGKLSEAEKYLKRAIQAGYGERPMAILSLASLYMDIMRENEARALLDSVMSEDEDPEISMRFARLELRANLRDRAVARLDRILVAQPKAVDAAVLKAQVLLREHAVNEALELARSAVGIAPTLAEARSTLGQALSLSGDLENAFDEVAEAVRLSPGVAAHVTELTRLALTLGRGREAVRFARDAARLDATNPQALALPARALALTRDYAAAEQELATAMRRASQSADLFALLGTIKEAQGNDGAAKAAFARALVLAPGSLDAVAGMALIEVRNGLGSAARKRIEEALAAHPRDSGYLQAAARVYATSGDQASADMMLQEALAVKRSDLTAAMTLLTPAFISKHPDTARGVLERLIEVRPRAIEARYRLGLLYEQIGRVAAAAQQYRAVLAEAPRPEMEMITKMATIRARALEVTVPR